MPYLYLVTYQLRPPLFRNTSAIVSALQKVGQWWHYMDNTWLIWTQETADQVFNRIAPTFQPNDLLLIVQITPDAAYQGWLPQEAWDWIHERLAGFGRIG